MTSLMVLFRHVLLKQAKLGLLVSVSLSLASCIALQKPNLAKPSLPISQVGQSLNKSFKLYERQVPLLLTNQGQMTILTLLNTNCPPCGEVVRQLNILKQEPDLQFTLYGMAVYSNDPIVIKDIKVNYRPLFPVANVQGSLGLINIKQSLPFNEIATVPVTYLIDEDGHLLESFFGSLPLRYIMKLIRSYRPKDDKQD